VRPANIFGPRQTGHGAISHFIVWALDNKPLTIYGDGSQVRSWCFVEDLTSAIAAVIEEEATGIFNIGNPYDPITVKALAEKIIKLTYSSSTLNYVPRRPVDIFHRVEDVDKAFDVLGWQPKWRFDDALKKTIQWYRSVNYGEMFDDC
jgi:UDP-glucuronate decarboxylase